MSLYSLPRPRHAERHHPASGAGRGCSRRRPRSEKLPLQRSAHIGALTDSSYVQLVGAGVAAIDLGFPCRYTHSSLEVCDLADLAGLTQLLVAGLAADRRRTSASTATTTPNEGTISASTSARSNRRACSSTTTGRIVATAAKPHKMLVPQPGWAEHRPREDWWDDFTFIIAEADRRQRRRAVRHPRRRHAAPSAPACCRSTRTASR